MNTTLTAAEKWLNEMGIRTMSRSACLMVNRDDMANFGPSGELPEKTYDDVLAALRESLNTKKIYWGGKDDNYLHLESF